MKNPEIPDARKTRPSRMRETRTAIFMRERRTWLRENPARLRVAARHRADDD